MKIDFKFRARTHIRISNYRSININRLSFSYGRSLSCVFFYFALYRVCTKIGIRNFVIRFFFLVCCLLFDVCVCRDIYYSSVCIHIVTYIVSVSAHFAYFILIVLHLVDFLFDSLQRHTLWYTHVHGNPCTITCIQCDMCTNKNIIR